MCRFAVFGQDFTHLVSILQLVGCGVIVRVSKKLQIWCSWWGYFVDLLYQVGCCVFGAFVACGRIQCICQISRIESYLLYFVVLLYLACFCVFGRVAVCGRCFMYLVELLYLQDSLYLVDLLYFVSFVVCCQDLHYLVGFCVLGRFAVFVAYS